MVKTMRKIDRHKDKAAKTINFDFLVLQKIENLARERRVSASSFVNDLMKQLVMNEKEYYKELARYHNAKFYHYKTMSEGLKK